MKRKVIGIALALALITSLFVFAAPVSAGPENAADQAEKQSLICFYQVIQVLR